MNDNDINHILQHDAQLREAVRRHEQQSPPLPAGLNERVMQAVEDSVKSEILKIKNEELRIKNEECVLHPSGWHFSRFTFHVSLFAAAACLLLFLLPHGWSTKEAVEETKTIAEAKTETKTETKTIAKMEVIASVEEKESVETHKSVARKKTRKKVRKIEPAIETKPVAKEQYTDTLGSHIFQSPENVLIAMKMLDECDAIYRNELQEVRNNVIDATFRVAPPSGSAILVKDMNGDLDVVDREKKRIIEL